MINEYNQGVSSNCVNCCCVPISSESSMEPDSPPNSEDITVTKLSNGSAEVTCNTSGQSCLALFQSETSPTSLDPMVVIGFIESPNDRIVVTLDATSDVYVVVYTWNSASGETIFDGQISFISRLELPISKSRVFRIACVLFLLLQLLPLHNHLLTVQNLHLYLHLLHLNLYGPS